MPNGRQDVLSELSLHYQLNGRRILSTFYPGFVMRSRRATNLYFFASCGIGILLSCYALLVELRAETNKEYKAFCDVSEYISCTKAFSSKYGKGFGFVGYILGQESILNQPNSLAGIVFYLILALTCFNEGASVVRLQVLLCIISNFFSLYLAYILYFVLEDFCLVCVGTYIVNAVNLALSMKKWNHSFIPDRGGSRDSSIKNVISKYQ